MPKRKGTGKYYSKISLRLHSRVMEEISFHAYWRRWGIQRYLRHAIESYNEISDKVEGTEEEKARAEEWLRNRKEKENKIKEKEQEKELATT